MSQRPDAKPPYEPPRIVFHSREEILRRAGPAVGCARWLVTPDVTGQSTPSKSATVKHGS